MVNRIKNSLTAKICILTSFLLMGVCAVLYLFISFFMPRTLISTLNEEVDSVAVQLVDRLRTMSLEESADMIYRFELENDVTVNIMSAAYTWIIVEGEWEVFTIDADDGSRSLWQAELEQANETYQSETEEDAGIQSQTESAGYRKEDQLPSAFYPVYWTYEVSFTNHKERMVMYIYGNAKVVNQVEGVLAEILPWLLLIFVVISIVTSIIYSLYITRPIVNVSTVSQKIARQDFQHIQPMRRTDEIGKLTESLNNLSDSLSKALSDLQMANEALNDDIKKEREREQRQMAFFAAVSHDLKTPVTVMKGQLEGMIDGVGAYKDRDKYLIRSYQTACRMEQIIQEILLISKMESSFFQPELKQLDLSLSIDKSLKQTADLFAGKDIEAVCDVGSNLMIMGDQILMDKVLNNLLANAASYSPAEATVKIRSWSEADTGAVCLTIENTGVHIEDAHLLRLFEPFYRIEKSRSRDSGGNGLGLYIVDTILTLHRAEYRIENAPEGVVFTIRFCVPGVSAD